MPQDNREDWATVWQQPDARTVRPGEVVRYHEPAERPAPEAVASSDARAKLPRVDRLANKMATARRRIVHLQERLDRPGGYHTSPSAEYDRAEIKMLESALELFEYVQRERGSNA